MIPAHKNIYESIRKKILDQEFKPGELLPSENDYCKSLHITRPTVRQALARLEAEGFIKKHKGKGSIIQEPKQGLGILSITGTTGALGSQDLQTVVKNPIFWSKWPASFMFELSDSEKEKGCLVLERIRYIKNKPVLMETTYFPDTKLNGFKNIDFKLKSLFDVLRKKYNIEIMSGEQKIKAIAAPEQMAKLLKVNAGTPILHLERKLVTSKTNFCFYSSIYCLTENNYLFGTF